MPALKSLAKKPVRELLSTRAEHSTVRELKARERKKLGFMPARIVERSANRQAKAYSLALSLANLLFPKNFPQLIASDRKDYKKTYSVKVRLSKNSEKGLADYYKGGYGSLEFMQNRRRLFYKHGGDIRTRLINFQRDKGIKTQSRTSHLIIYLEKKGISVNDNFMNIGFAKEGNQPVFFEIHGVSIPSLERTIVELPERTPAEKLKKRQALELLEGLKKEANGKDYLKAHV